MPQLISIPVMTMPKPITGTDRKRRPLFTPQYRHVELTLTEQDFRLLHLLKEHRVLSAAMIKTLMPDWNWEQLRHRLTELYHHFYVDRPKLQIYWKIAHDEAWTMIYAPTNKGLSAINLSTRTRYDTKNQRLSPLYLRHRLSINAVAIALQEAIKARPELQLQVAWWRFDRQWHITLNQIEAGERKEVSLWPDSFFGLWDHERQRRAVYFLEIDTGSEDHGRVMEKLKLYQRLALLIDTYKDRQLPNRPASF